MPHEDIRKIVRVGHSSLAVVLPKSWLRYYNLGYGDSVKVIANGSVIIKQLSKEEKEELRRLRLMEEKELRESGLIE